MNRPLIQLPDLTPPDRAPQIVRYEPVEPTTPPARNPQRRLGAEIRAALGAERESIDSVLRLIPEDIEPTARTWEQLAEEIARAGARLDQLVRRCRTAARRAHLEQR